MKKKANDKGVPEDEMLLAEALAAARARGLGWCKERPFEGAGGGGIYPPEYAVRCCALGALHLAGRANMECRSYYTVGRLADVVEGNDIDKEWMSTATDRGASMGWAFRCAMTQDEESP